MTLDHLAEAMKHVESGWTLVMAQRGRVEHARRLGLDVTDHATTLALLEEIQALHIAQRDRLRAELKALNAREAAR